MSRKDKLFDTPINNPQAFVFDEAVARVFPDMIHRSVPGYADVIQGAGLIAGHYATDHSNVYDLGCSLGASTLAMNQKITARDCTIIAVDNSEDMIQACRANLETCTNDVRIEPVVANIQDIGINNASVVIMNYTLQFIPVDERNALVTRIYNGMNPGGVFLLSEKLAFADPHEQQELTMLHEAFKRANGYSELEISQKRSALENVLLPETLDRHLERLRQAGFHRISPWFRYINFVSLLAWK